MTGQYLPHHVGIPIGGRNGPKYYMLEIHYDNPKAKRSKFDDTLFFSMNPFDNSLFIFSPQVIDHSGFRIHYTKHLRREDGGMMISGVSVSDTQLIPPQQKLYRNVGICGPSCTSTVMTLTQSHLHGHCKKKFHFYF